MNTETKRKMAEVVRGFRMPRYCELPDTGLYLEQTTKYLNVFLAPLDCLDVTSTMISNYVKKGLLPSPIRKLYYAEHIAYLFFIAVAKNLVSMDDIHLLIEMQRSTYTLPVAYDYLCDEMENMLFYLFGLKDTIDSVGVTDTDEKNLLSNLIFSSVNAIYMHACFKQIRAEAIKKLDNQ